jgi:predicted small lipoprotein YifL
MRRLTSSVLVALVTVATVAGCGAQRSPLGVAPQASALQASRMTSDEIKLERIKALVGSWSMAYVTHHYKGESPTVELKSTSVRAAATGGYNFTVKVYYKDANTAGHVQVKGHYDNKNRKYSQVSFKELDIDHLNRR